MTVSATDLTVIIPTRDRWATLVRTLRALDQQTVAGFAVVVVVDGADQRPPPRLPGNPRLLVKPHAGPGAARNHGVAASTHPLVLFLGDDMVPAPQLVAAHLARHRRDGGRDLAVLGHVDWHPEIADNRILRWLDWSTTQFDYADLEGRGGQDVGFGRFYSSNVSLRRELFEVVGGFDEDFVYYYEDLDMGWRLAQAGMRLLYTPRAVAHHLQTYDLAALRRRFAGIALGERLMADKHDWFDPPYFHDRIRRAVEREPASRWWARIVDWIPPGWPLRERAEREATAWYHQQVAEHFLHAWDGAGEVVELRDYLGDVFEARKLMDHAGEVQREADRIDDETDFYRTSHNYLYDLTAFSMSGTKQPYRDELTRLLPPGARLLDYGCGIGSDGLALLADGFEVAFADFDNPSTTYLRWRLERRGWNAEIYDIEHDSIPRDFQAVYAFDVIEHVDDPVAFLAHLESLAGIVAVNLLEPADGDTHGLHRELPIHDLVARARRRGLHSHTVHHGRSHLIIYRGSGAAVPAGGR